jgi:hypothetical protein
MGYPGVLRSPDEATPSSPRSMRRLAASGPHLTHHALLWCAPRATRRQMWCLRCGRAGGDALVKARNNPYWDTKVYIGRAYLFFIRYHCVRNDTLSLSISYSSPSLSGVSPPPSGSEPSQPSPVLTTLHHPIETFFAIAPLPTEPQEILCTHLAHTLSRMYYIYTTPYWIRK